MKKGDRVRIITKAYERNSNAPHFACCGTVGEEQLGRPDVFLVHRDGRSSVWYYADDLEIIPENSDLMIDPEMDLDEIHLAQSLIEGS